MKKNIRTPFFLVDEVRLIHNLEILQRVQKEGECKILLAQKAFAMFSAYPLMRNYLAGSTAIGLYEARLGKEEFGGKPMCFLPPIGKMNLKKSFVMRIILCLILHPGAPLWAKGKGSGKSCGTPAESGMLHPGRRNV